MKKCLYGMVLSLSLLSVSLSQELTKLRAPLDKPNVIVIYLDDAGYGDFKFTGNNEIETPELDKLSKQGLFLNNFHSGSPACSASRYALMTGKSPARSGFGTWVLYPNTKQFIHPKEQTVAETMKAAGYATAHIGKWHLGVPNKENNRSKEALPTAHGFDSYLGIPYSNDMKPAVLLKQPGDSESYPGADIVEDQVDQKNLTQRYFQAACDFVVAHKNEPFFMYLTPSMPHVPLYVSDAFKGKSKTGRLYDDVIQELDYCVGKLVKTVDSAGLGKNTLIIFSSDNGPWLIQGKDAGKALPYRDGKASAFEGGTRVPGLMRWTGVIDPGENGALTSVLDIHPTLAALVKQKINPYGELDGRDISYLFNKEMAKNKPAQDDYMLVMTGKSKNTPLSVQQGNWKIHFDTFSQLWHSKKITDHNSPVVKASLEQPLLYDLSKDIAESTNVASDHPEVVDKLKKRFEEFKQSIAHDLEMRKKENPEAL